MKEIIITKRKELYSRLAYAELYFNIENNGKTITFECPTEYQDDEKHVLGYSYWGDYAKYIYNFDEYDSLTGVVYDTFQFYQEKYKKNLELKIDLFKRSIL